MPGSLAALFTAIALVPGFVFLKLTERHRRVDHRPSPIDNVLLLVAAGIACTGPVALVATWLADDTVIELLTTPVDEMSKSLLRRVVVLVAATFVGAMGLALASSFAVRLTRSVRAGESGWHEAFRIAESVQVDVTLKDGRVVQGFLQSYDGVSHGVGRDLVIAPSDDGDQIRVVQFDGEIAELDCDRWVISETQVDAVAVHALERSKP